MRKLTEAQRRALMRLRLFDERIAARAAAIIGPQGAAAKALADLERRRSAGECVALYIDDADGCFVVGPDARAALKGGDDS